MSAPLYRKCWVYKLQDLRQIKQDINLHCCHLKDIKSLKHRDLLPCLSLVLRTWLSLGAATQGLKEQKDGGGRCASAEFHYLHSHFLPRSVRITFPCVFLLLIGRSASRHDGICCWALDQAVLFKSGVGIAIAPRFCAPSADLRHNWQPDKVYCAWMLKEGCRLESTSSKCTEKATATRKQLFKNNSNKKDSESLSPQTPKTKQFYKMFLSVDHLLLISPPHTTLNSVHT